MREASPRAGHGSISATEQTFYRWRSEYDGLRVS